MSMAKLYANSQTGEIAKASQFNGLRTMINELGFELLIDNYRSFYYGVYRRYNPDTGKYEFRKVSKVNDQKEKILINEGYEKIKAAYSNKIPKEFLWQGYCEKSDREV